MVFLPCLWKIFVILSTLLTIASDRQIGSRTIETFQGGPFGRVVETGFYKEFIPSAFGQIISVLREIFQNWGGGGCSPPTPAPVRLCVHKSFLVELVLNPGYFACLPVIIYCSLYVPQTSFEICCFYL